MCVCVCVFLDCACSHAVSALQEYIYFRVFLFGALYCFKSNRQDVYHEAKVKLKPFYFQEGPIE